MRHHLYILATLLTAGAGAIVATTMDSRPTPGTMTPPDETFHTCLTARPDNQPPKPHDRRRHQPVRVRII